MPKQAKIHWRKGRRPGEITDRVMRDSPPDIYKGFPPYIKKTAGKRGGWPVLTGESRDAFKVINNILIGTDYATKVNERYDNVLGKLWEEYDFSEELQDVVDEVR